MKNLEDKFCSHKECSLEAEFAVKIQPPIALKYTAPASLIYCCETHYDDVISRVKWLDFEYKVYQRRELN